MRPGTLVVLDEDRQTRGVAELELRDVDDHTGMTVARELRQPLGEVRSRRHVQLAREAHDGLTIGVGDDRGEAPVVGHHSGSEAGDTSSLLNRTIRVSVTARAVGSDSGLVRPVELYGAAAADSITLLGDSPDEVPGTPWVMPQRVRVALLDDYSIVIAGLQALLAPYDDKLVVVDKTVGERPHRDVDVTLFDTYGERNSFEARVREVAADGRAGAIVVFSFSDQPTLVRRLLQAGAQGFISKTAPPELIVDGILAAARGERVMITQRSQRARIQSPITWPGRDAGLTERESEILALLPTGMTNDEIAEHLYVSVNTVKTQLRQLYSKLGVRNRVEAVTRARNDMLAEQGRVD